MKNEIRLYNMIIPIWMLFYLTWFFNPLIGAGISAAMLLANFGIDTAVMFIAMHVMKTESQAVIYKSRIWLAWLFGFAGDAVGNVMLFLATLTENSWISENIARAVSYNPFSNVWGLLYTVAAIVVSAAAIYLFDRYIVFRRLDAKTARGLSLALAVFTAPYLYLIPTEWFIG